MNDTRKLAVKGFGSVMVARLREGSASTEALALEAGVTPQQAYSRLSFLQSQEGLLKSVGKGIAKVWFMADAEAPEMDVVAPTDAFNHDHGWKPSLDHLTAVSADTDLSKGTKVMVEYPEGWRHTSFLSLKHAPDAEGVALCWDMRNDMNVYAPVTAAAAAKHGCRVHVVEGEREIAALAA